MLFIPDFSDCRATIDVYLSNLARAKPKLCVAALPRKQLRSGAGGTSQLRTFPGQHFDTVNCRPDRDVPKRQCISWLDRSVNSAHKWCTGRYALGSNDVAALAIDVTQECDICASVRIVLKALYLCSDPVLVPKEIDLAVMVFVTTAFVPGGDLSRVIATSGLVLCLCQRWQGAPLMKRGVYYLDKPPPTR